MEQSPSCKPIITQSQSGSDQWVYGLYPSSGILNNYKNTTFEELGRFRPWLRHGDSTRRQTKWNICPSMEGDIKQHSVDGD
jgi:hypothetical protein